MEKIIKKGRLNWLIRDEEIIAFDRLQATMYHSYDIPNKQPFENMKQEVLDSSDDEYATWADVLDLASKKGLIGYGTRVRSEWSE